MANPRTAAGRALLDVLRVQDSFNREIVGVDWQTPILAIEAEARGLDVEQLAAALAVVFAYNESNASVAPNGSLAFGEGPTSYWRDRAEAVLAALAAEEQGS